MLLILKVQHTKSTALLFNSSKLYTFANSKSLRFVVLHIKYEKKSFTICNIQPKLKKIAILFVRGYKTVITDA